jgi:hypothetical protein
MRRIVASYPIVIRGEPWRLRFVRKVNPQYAVGLCDWNKKVIEVKCIGDPYDDLNTVIHELLHGCFPDHAEEAVYRAANEISSVVMVFNNKLPGMAARTKKNSRASRKGKK